MVIVILSLKGICRFYNYDFYIEKTVNLKSFRLDKPICHQIWTNLVYFSIFINLVNEEVASCKHLFCNRL